MGGYWTLAAVSGGLLLEYVSPVDHYLGVDKDELSITKANQGSKSSEAPIYIPEPPLSAEPKFDSIVSLAVIEHVSEPKLRFLAYLVRRI